MFDTFTTVVGTVVSDPRRRSTPTGENIISFRVGSTARRFDRDIQQWLEGPTLYLTVSCWRRLLIGVEMAIVKGRPVIVHGQIKTNEYTTTDGTKRADLEMSATAVGLDLARCVVDYRGPSRTFQRPPGADVVRTPSDQQAA